jgi:polyhydroxyalkanoate synthesis repressor PhaR
MTKDAKTRVRPPVVIKKYANRRLYNTETSMYVTLDALSQMVKEGTDFIVYDAKTGDDLTRTVLTQIIVEEESKGQTMLPIGFLRQLIGHYGGDMQWLLPRYLEHSLQSFTNNQGQVHDYFKKAFGGIFPFGTLEEVSKQNMALLESAFRMFAQPLQADDAPSAPGPAPAAEKTGAEKTAADTALQDMQARLDDLQKQLNSLGKKK